MIGATSANSTRLWPRARLTRSIRRRATDTGKPLVTTRTAFIGRIPPSELRFVPRFDIYETPRPLVTGSRAPVRGPRLRPADYRGCDLATRLSRKAAVDTPHQRGRRGRPSNSDCARRVVLQQTASVPSMRHIALTGEICPP